MVLVLVAILGFAGAQPGVAEGRLRVSAHPVSVLDRIWDWLTGQGVLTRLWAEQGLGMDPDGSRATVPPTPSTHVGMTGKGDQGMGMDPNG